MTTTALLVMDVYIAIGEVHRVLTEKVFPRHAVVTSIDEWAASL